MRWAKIIVFLLGITPLLFLIIDASTDNLGANPVEKITHTTGSWALRFLLITLALSPLRHLTGLPVLVRFRRMLGLFSFLYASLHFLIWPWLDEAFRWQAIMEDVVERPYVTLGLLSFLMLIPLAVTSNRKMKRRLGRHWRRLHQLIYLAAISAVLHFIWLVKADWMEPLVYGLLLAVLLLARLIGPGWVNARSSVGGPGQGSLSKS